MASLRSAPVLPPSSSYIPRVFRKHMPAELVSEILKYLQPEQRDLWRAAAVSRTFYASAWHAGLYIHRTLGWDTDSSDWDKGLTVLREVVRHTVDRGLRLSLSFITPEAVKYEPEEEDAGNDSVAVTEAALEILAQVTASLPVLVSLSLGLSESFCSAVYDSLRHPAPRLEEFYFCVYPATELELVRYTVATDLFAGIAPRLRQLALRNVPLGSAPVQAFARVPDADVYYEFVFPDVDFARHFPVVRTLRLAFFATQDTVMEPPRLNFDGLSLQKLIIGDSVECSLIPYIDGAVKLCDIPVIEYEADCVFWSEPIWQPKARDQLSIRVTQPMIIPDSDLTIRIVPREHRTWRRTCRLIEWSRAPAAECPISDIPDLGSRLVTLRMDNYCVTSLLECHGLALDALRDLWIDFKSEGPQAALIWPPDWLDALSEWDRELVSCSAADRSAPTFAEGRESYSHVHCPNLEAVTLFALDVAMCVESQEAAFLGRALSQLPRPEKDRTALVLVGIDFKKPVAHALLEETFSAVRYLRFAGFGSAAEKDGGLWDEGV